MADEIDRCERCGGLLKRLRDVDQAVCRCAKPIRPGRRGRAPNPSYIETLNEDESDTELARESLGSGFKPDD